MTAKLRGGVASRAMLSGVQEFDMMHYDVGDLRLALEKPWTNAELVAPDFGNSSSSAIERQSIMSIPNSRDMAQTCFVAALCSAHSWLGVGAKRSSKPPQGFEEVHVINDRDFGRSSSST
ncbi:hypothetical protein HYALB_00010609 [Hymenoscyphus albidus]|uniref:Uncharacterized protein n=1 Tax=Hymenoscyphus albidus TaxID=595503 RepID=A0A9N9LMK8_9HELO|nr:hypothetical protein HYALB_00010609 [Hymenoscyphus albidus]